MTDIMLAGCAGSAAFALLVVEFAIR
jgi:hypothetical protein